MALMAEVGMGPKAKRKCSAAELRQSDPEMAERQERQ
jgi:hypothetical protein